MEQDEILILFSRCTNPTRAHRSWLWVHEANGTLFHRSWTRDHEFTSPMDVLQSSTVPFVVFCVHLPRQKHHARNQPVYDPAKNYTIIISRSINCIITHKCFTAIIHSQPALANTPSEEQDDSVGAETYCCMPLLMATSAQQTLQISTVLPTPFP